MNCFVDHLVIFSIALLIDLSIGDPPERIDRFYPIVWISRLMYFLDRRTRREDLRKEKLLGVVYPLLILIIFAVPCLLLPLIPSELLYIALGSLVFKMTFTIKGLERFGRAALEATDIEAKRAAVGKIVSRNVADLDTELLDSATIESVAENLTDSVIAPFFYFVLFGIFGAGVFGAMVYRVINTLDAVVGYKTRDYFYLGWFSAKTDTALNYIPERIAAGLILLTAKSKGQKVIPSGPEEHIPLTIRAMSHALQVKLEKKGYYVVGEGYESASESHIEGAIRVMKRSSLLFAFLCLVVLSLLYFVSLSRCTSFTAASTALFA
ncbi:MAG: cobalamin biosynthesis protein CobD [Methanophagales archaeon ANME-1-THS]|nr:MAG: cobalamin biosynthesis protein CobD [Methanophagales archaeon ANME-1-THS]